MDGDAPLNQFEESVLGELEKIRNLKSNWLQILAILVISLVLFIGLGARKNPVAFTATLVGVLLFHELGHYVGMRIFGYRNVRMFFIPFFGAAVSGQKTSAKSYQEVVVTLLGPLPGLCLAVVLIGVACIPALGREYRLELIRASMLLGLINGFNLLPVLPLDGGRVSNTSVHPGSKLFIAKADGSGPQEVGDGDWPSWSPDGKKLALYVEKRPIRVLYLLDLETQQRSELGPGYYRAQWAGDGRSVVSNGIRGVAPSGAFYRGPARFWLDRPGKPEFFFTDMDNPWSPCVSRDGKTIALIVDSRTRGKGPRAGIERKSSVGK
jgi:hypothetical protein